MVFQTLHQHIVAKTTESVNRVCVTCVCVCVCVCVCGIKLWSMYLVTVRILDNL